MRGWLKFGMNIEPVCLEVSDLVGCSYSSKSRHQDPGPCHSQLLLRTTVGQSTADPAAQNCAANLAKPTEPAVPAHKPARHLHYTVPPKRDDQSDSFKI